MQEKINHPYAHRMSRVKIVLTDPSGAPCRNQSVTVRQIRHQFLFGCSEFSVLPYVSGEMDAQAAETAEKRFGHMAELLNSVTLPFYWGGYEPVQGNPGQVRMEKAARWLSERKFTLKGHPLCWHTSTAPWLLKLSNEEILKVQLARIEREVTAFKGLVDMWDVINEAVIMPVFNRYDNGITRICKERGRIRLVRDVFNEARRANPDAVLIINDFETSDAYDILVEGLLEAGVPISAIGIQSHMHQGYWGVEKTEEILERFSRFGLPLHFSETSLVSGALMPEEIVDLNDFKTESWPSTAEGEARQAEETVTHYETLFKHPLVQSVTWWSFMDGLWLGAPSGLLDRNSDPKPVYRALHDKIKGEWWFGEQTMRTDDDGAIEVNGYKGEYAAVCEGRETTFTVE